MISTHNGLAVSARIKEGHKEALTNILSQIEDQGAAENNIYSFGNLKTAHFATLVIIPEEQTPSGKLLPSRFLFLTSYAGDRKKHVRELAENNPHGLAELFKHCEDFPEEVSSDSVYRYIRKKTTLNTFYTGFQYVTYTDVGKEYELREAIENYLDKANDDPGFKNKSAKEVRNDIQGFVKNEPNLSWVVKPYKRSFGSYIKLLGPLYILVAILGISLICCILVFFWPSIFTWTGTIIFLSFIGTLITVLLLLRVNESRPFEPVPEPTDERIYDIVSREKYPIKNEMTVAGPLKRGWIRPIFLFITLRLVWFIRAFSYIPTVHTARWFQVDGGRRIVFIAYFDNTSEAYAHDFVDSDIRVRNLNLIFGNGNGFPPTKWAVIGGGKDRRKYITAVRAQQKITNVWYYTYPHIGILNINNNRAIRKGLWGEMSEGEAEKWLLRF